MSVRLPAPPPSRRRKSQPSSLLRTTLLAAILILAGVSAALAASAALSRSNIADASPAGSLSTPEHLRASAWWPTKPAEPSRYVGTATCAECHAGIVRSQSKSQMFRTFGPAVNSSVLAREKLAPYTNGDYTYRAALSNNHTAAVVDVNDSHGKLHHVELKWFLGSGDVGQSFLWQDGAGFDETRFNYFRSLNAIGSTPGRLSAPPTSFKMAVGRPIEPFEVRSCLSCHTTQYPAAGPITDAHLVGGVQCEACHGPGAAHVAAARQHAGDADVSYPAAPPWDPEIFNIARLTPVNAVDGCGACHSTPTDVRLLGAAGVETVRFPAYRLEKSVCWGQNGDARLICSSCHDPHAPLEKEPSAYDHVCQSCHTGAPPATLTTVAANSAVDNTSGRLARLCPVAKTRCVSCHMPKYPIPEMHARFTDHRIQINQTPAKWIP